MYAQIAGKIKLALAPPEPEWAHAAFYLTARGLTSGPLPHGEQALELAFDFISHEFRILSSDGGIRSIPLWPGSVATFYIEVMAALRSLDAAVEISTMPQEVPGAIPFDRDHVHASYDPLHAHRFWRTLSRIDAIFKQHRAPFRGRHTPVHFFWGSFDLAYERFSGRPAAPPPNAGAIARESMDAQGIAAGFWPGDARFPEPAFYCYAYPKPERLESAAIAPAAAFWSTELGEFILRYEDVRTSAAPRETIATFLTATFEACAKQAGWNSGAPEPSPAANA
jgi:hypothetical protein